MTDTARFDLYAFWRTSATYRVRVAFNLKGVQPNEINVNLEAGEQRSEAYLKLNPMGAIPALIDNAPDLALPAASTSPDPADAIKRITRPRDFIAVRAFHSWVRDSGFLTMWASSRTRQEKGGPSERCGSFRRVP